MQRQLVSWLTAILLCMAVPLASAGPAGEAIRSGGVALLIRHATAPGTGDPESGEVVVVARAGQGVKVIGTIKPTVAP